MQQFPAELIRLSPRATSLGFGNALENIITNELGDGARCYVQEVKSDYVLDKTSTAVADGFNIVAPIAGPGRWVLTPQQELANAPIRTIQIVGDSNWAGSNGADTGMVAVARQAFYQQLRAWRDDFDFIGTDASPPEGVASFGLWHNEAHPGFSMATMTTNYPGYVAITGAPEIIVDMIGAGDLINDGLNAAQMFQRRLALDAAYAAANPNAIVVPMGIAPFVPGTTTGGNLAAWTATRAQYNALLQAYAATKANYHYSNITDSLGEGDFLVDGVHLNQYGQSKMGQGIAQLLDILLGARRGNPLPNIFLQRKPWASESLPVAATSTLTATAHAGFNPGAGSFALAFDYYPTLLDAGGLHTVAQFGTYGANNFWALYQQGSALRVYFNDPAGTVFNQPQQVSLVLNTWHRIVMIAYANGANSSVGLYVNGKLVGLATGQPLWNMTLQNTVWGNLGVTGCPAYVSRIAAYKGASVPEAGHMAALQAVEEDYYKGRDLVPGAGSAIYPLNTGLNDDISGNPALVAAGGAIAEAAWPTGPARPWEYTGA